MIHLLLQPTEEEGEALTHSRSTSREDPRGRGATMREESQHNFRHFFKGKTEDQPMAPLVELHFGNHGNDRPRLSGKSCGGMSGSAISISMLDQ